MEKARAEREAPFANKNVYGKAKKKAKLALPKDPFKKKAVLDDLVKENVDELGDAMEVEEIEPDHSTRGIPNEVKEKVREFYYSPDISYHFCV